MSKTNRHAAKCRSALLGGTVGHRRRKACLRWGQRGQIPLPPPPTSALQPRPGSLPLPEPAGPVHRTAWDHMPVLGPHIWLSGPLDSTSWAWFPGGIQQVALPSGLGAANWCFCSPAALARDQPGPSTQDRGWTGSFLQPLLLGCCALQL